MRSKSNRLASVIGPRRYRSPKIPMTAIGRYADQIAEVFDPERIILFGSYAYGVPHDGSDVDLLVVMPAANQHHQAVRIRLALPAPFPLDLIVQTPTRLKRRLADGNWFLREIVEKGQVLYEKRDGTLGEKSRGRHARCSPASRRKTDVL